MKEQVIKVSENGCIEVEVFSKRVALDLRKKGHRIIRTEPNEYKPIFDTYIFEDKGSFIEDFEAIKLSTKH